MIESNRREDGFNEQQHLLNQNKLIMKMANRFSARRMEADILILPLNTSRLIGFASQAKE